MVAKGEGRLLGAEEPPGVPEDRLCAASPPAGLAFSGGMEEGGGPPPMLEVDGAEEVGACAAPVGSGWD